MPQRRYIVLIETAHGPHARFTVPATATQVDVAMRSVSGVWSHTEYGSIPGRPRGWSG